MHLLSTTNNSISMNGRHEIGVSRCNIWQIFRRGWAKHRDMSMSCRSIDLWENDKSRYSAITDSIIVSWFDHQVCFHILITTWQLREAICHFSLENVVSITHGQNIIYSKTLLDGITHEQTIICRQLFAGHVVGSRPMKSKKKCIEW